MNSLNKLATTIAKNFFTPPKGRSNSKGKHPDVQCPRCPFRGRFAKGGAAHEGSKACTYRRNRARLYSDGWAPVFSYGRILEAAEVPIHIEPPGTCGPVRTRWSPSWALVICACVETSSWSTSRRQMETLIDTLEKVREWPSFRRESLEAIARMSGEKAIAKMFKLKVTQWENALWWLDRENDVL